MATSTTTFRLLCPNPACGQEDLIQEFRFLSDPEPTPYIRCRACGWAAVKEQGVRDAIAAGRAAYNRNLEAVLAKQRERDAAANVEREAAKRQAALADAENTIRAWATGPVSDRVVNRGTWEVRPPDLAPGVDLSDLDEGVRSVYAAAVAEAEVEVRCRDLEDVERLAKARAEQPKLWAEQAQRDAEERRRRRAEQSDVEVSHPEHSSV